MTTPKRLARLVSPLDPVQGDATARVGGPRPLVRSDIRPSPRPRIALVVLALILGVLFAYPGSGLLLGWSSTVDGGIHRFHTVVWGVHTGLALSVGLLALLVRTEARVATAQQVGVAMTVMMTVFFASVVLPHFGAPGVGIDRAVFSISVLVLTGVILALHPRREEILTSGQAVSRPMATLGVVGLAVAAPYALDQIQIQLAVDLATDPHSAGGREHWTEMAIATLTLPLIALVAALRTRGFRLVAWTTGTGTVIFGAASALLPEQASSPGVAWGTAAMLGGILFVAVAEFETRRESPNPRGQCPTSGAAQGWHARVLLSRRHERCVVHPASDVEPVDRWQQADPASS